MRKACILLNKSKTASLSVKRFYRGKYLTSYQKKITQDERQLIINTITPEPTSILVSLAVNETLNNNNSEEIKISNEISNDPKLIEFVNEYISSDSEIRKLLFYGSENKSIQSSPYNCCGCGSTINCESVYKPGYIPYEVYEKAENDSEFMKNILCVRCFFLSNDLDPLDVSIDRDIYDDIIMKQLLKYKSGVVLLLVDMSDLPFSIPLNLSLYNLSQIRLVLIGNKSDLLHHSSTTSAYYEQRLIEAAISRGIDKSKIEKVDLISAKDCNRIENLLDMILSVDFYKNEPIFLIGSTNSGKSSLFNRLLKSDLCKSIAKPNMQSAVVSNVPGTTLNLLKFPMVNLTTNFKNRRQQAKHLLSAGKFESSVREKYPLIESYKLATQPTRSQSFYELVTYAYKDNQITSNSYNKDTMLNEFATQKDFDESKIITNKWLYDTPGLVNPDQIVSYLPKEDVDRLYENNNLSKPKIFILKEGLTIIFENLARIDVLEVNKYIYLSVHARLPAEIVDTNDIDRYYSENDHITMFSFRKNLSPPLLERIKSRVPNYDMEISTIPDSVPVDMEIQTNGLDLSTADIILSSIGWIGISGMKQSTCKIRVWTPAAIGCAKRVPSLMPDAVTRRSTRKSYSREFHVT